MVMITMMIAILSDTLATIHHDSSNCTCVFPQDSRDTEQLDGVRVRHARHWPTDKQKNIYRLGVSSVAGGMEGYILKSLRTTKILHLTKNR